MWAGHPVQTRAQRLSPPCYISYIVFVSLALEKKLEIIGELKKGKSLRCLSGLYDIPKSTVVSHSQTL